MTRMPAIVASFDSEPPVTGSGPSCFGGVVVPVGADVVGPPCATLVEVDEVELDEVGGVDVVVVTPGVVLVVVVPPGVVVTGGSGGHSFS